MTSIKSAIQVIALVVVAIFASILISEVFIRIVAPQNLTGTSRVQDDTGLLLNKDSGHSQHQFFGTSVVYHFGKYHDRLLAHPVSEIERKPRVLVLGDSFTFGWLIADGATYVDMLQDKYRNYQFINAAAAGWGTADYTKYVENYCTDIKPQIVLAFLNSDDIARTFRSGLYAFENGKLTPEKVQKDPLKTFLNKLPLYNFVSEHSQVLALIKAAFYRSQPQRDISGQQFPHFNMEDESVRKTAVAKGQATFLRLKTAAAACGAKLVVIYTGWVDYNDPASDLDPTMNFMRQAGAFFSANDITFYNLTSDPAMTNLRAHRPDYILPGDWHPNEKGVKVIFQATMDALNGTVLTESPGTPPQKTNP